MSHLLNLQASSAPTIRNILNDLNFYFPKRKQSNISRLVVDKENFQSVSEHLDLCYSTALLAYDEQQVLLVKNLRRLPKNPYNNTHSYSLRNFSVNFFVTPCHLSFSKDLSESQITKLEEKTTFILPKFNPDLGSYLKVSVALDLMFELTRINEILGGIGKGSLYDSFSYDLDAPYLSLNSKEAMLGMMINQMI